MRAYKGHNGMYRELALRVYAVGGFTRLDTCIWSITLHEAHVGTCVSM